MDAKKSYAEREKEIKDGLSWVTENLDSLIHDHAADVQNRKTIRKQKEPGAGTHEMLGQLKLLQESLRRYEDCLTSARQALGYLQPKIKTRWHNKIRSIAWSGCIWDVLKVGAGLVVGAIWTLISKGN